jgi:hypothetical protein
VKRYEGTELKVERSVSAYRWLHLETWWVVALFLHVTAEILANPVFPTARSQCRAFNLRLSDFDFEGQPRKDDKGFWVPLRELSLGTCSDVLLRPHCPFCRLVAKVWEFDYQGLPDVCQVKTNVPHPFDAAILLKTRKHGKLVIVVCLLALTSVSTPSTG